MADGLVEASVEGTPQGGRLSPLLANIYLDALDKEREKRGHCFCRYADDCNIYVGSQTAAERTQASIQSWIEKHLRLKVKPLRAERGRHDRRGRERRLRQLGLKGTALGVATSSRGAWRVAAQPELQRALSNSVLRRYGFLVLSDLASP
jgi:hypothetical protein